MRNNTELTDGELWTLSYDEVNQLKDEVGDDIASIRTQLETKKSRSDWRRRARAAVRLKGRYHQKILRHLGERRRIQKAENIRLSREESNTYPRRFMRAAKELLAPSTYQEILVRADELGVPEGHDD